MNKFIKVTATTISLESTDKTYIKLLTLPINQNKITR